MEIKEYIARDSEEFWKEEITSAEIEQVLGFEK